MPRRRGRPRIYDWDRWFARDRFVLTAGKEYRVSQSSMVSQIRDAAGAAGVSVHIEDKGDRIEVRVNRERASA